MEDQTLFGLSVRPDGKRIVFTPGTPKRDEVWVLKGFPPPLRQGNSRRAR